MQLAEAAGTYPNLCDSPLTFQRRWRREEEEVVKPKRHRVPATGRAPQRRPPLSRFTPTAGK